MKIRAIEPSIGRMGRPPFKPTSAKRKEVTLYKASGMSETDIGAALGISRGALRRHFKAELRSGRAVQRAKNLKRLVEAADKGSVMAQKALHCIFDQGDRADLLRDPDFGARSSATAEAKVRARLSKKDLVRDDAINAGVNSDWADDLPPPPMTRRN